MIDHIYLGINHKIDVIIYLVGGGVRLPNRYLPHLGGVKISLQEDEEGKWEEG